MNTQLNKQKGFIQIIILVIIVVLVLAFLGVDAKGVWTDYILPILEFIWNAFITVISFVIDITIKLANKVGIGS